MFELTGFNVRALHLEIKLVLGLQEQMQPKFLKLSGGLSIDLAPTNGSFRANSEKCLRAPKIQGMMLHEHMGIVTLPFL